MNRNTTLYVLFLMFALAASSLVAQPGPVTDPIDPVDDQVGNPVDDDDDEIVVDTVYIPPYMEGVGYLDAVTYGFSAANSEELAFTNFEGGTGPYTWEWSGLPQGLSSPFLNIFLSSTMPYFSGVPAVGTAADSPYTVTLTVTDANGLQATAEGTLVVLPAPEDVQDDDPTIQFFGSEALVKGEMELVVPDDVNAPWPDDSPYKGGGENAPPVMQAVKDAEFYATRGAHTLGAAIVGGRLPYQSIDVEGLPDGMTWDVTNFNSDSATQSVIQIGGIPETPKSVGALNTFATAVPHHTTITVVDADGRATSVDIGFSVASAIGVSTNFFPAAFTQEWYATDLVAFGGGGEDGYTWSGKFLPDGLEVAKANNGDWKLRGTPHYDVDLGVHTIQLTVTDSSSSRASESFETFFVVNEGIPLSPMFADDPILPDRVVVNQPMSIELNHDGGMSNHTWTSNEELPDGLELAKDATAQWMLVGTPTMDISEATNYTISLTLTDSSFPPQEIELDSFVLTIEPALAFEAIEGNSLPDAEAGVYYSYQFPIIGGVAPYDFDGSSISSAIPVGLQFTTAANGFLELTGIPVLSSASNDPYTVNPAAVSDDQTNGFLEFATASLELKIDPAPLTIQTTSLGSVFLDQPYLQKIQVIGGVAPFSVAVTGLPAGLSVGYDEASGLHTVEGLLTGSGLVSGTIELRVTDSALPTPSTSFTKLSLVVLEASDIEGLVLETPTLAAAVEGESYASAAFQVSGGNGSYQWEESMGLPPGISLTELSNDTAVFSGTPKAGSAGTYLVSLKVSDTSASDPQTVSRIVPITVKSDASEDFPNEQSAVSTISSALVSGAAAGCAFASGPRSAFPFLLLILCLASLFYLQKSRSKGLQH